MPHKKFSFKEKCAIKMLTNTPTKLPLEAKYFGPKVKSRRSSVAILEKHEETHSSNIAKEYADATSLHGLKYIAEDERHPIERLKRELFIHTHI